MNKDVVVDTHILVSILEQYSSDNEFALIKSRDFGEDLSSILNYIIINKGDNGFIVASPIAIVEIVNKFDEICISRNVSFEKLKAFVVQPPSWLLIEPMSLEVISCLAEIDCVVLYNNELKPVEINDALHVATTLVRSVNSILATKDGRIKLLPAIQGRTVS